MLYLDRSNLDESDMICCDRVKPIEVEVRYDISEINGNLYYKINKYNE